MESHVLIFSYIDWLIVEYDVLSLTYIVIFTTYVASSLLFLVHLLLLLFLLFSFYKALDLGVPIIVIFINIFIIEFIIIRIFKNVFNEPVGCAARGIVAAFLVMQ